MPNRTEEELDGLSGARKSMRARVLSVADDTLALLDDLHAGDDDALHTPQEKDEIENLRGGIRSGLTELVGELTVSGGPRVRRVEDIFALLLDQMSSLQDLLPDEGESSLFPIIADQMASLYRSWNNMQQLFSVQMNIVSKQLGLVAESVSDLRFAMNGASLGPAERQIMIVRFDAPGYDAAIREHEPMSLENLLGWVETFAAEAGPRALSEDGGFALATRIAPAALRLAGLLRTAIDGENPGAIPRKSMTPQIERALSSVAGRLDEVAWTC